MKSTLKTTSYFIAFVLLMSTQTFAQTKEDQEKLKTKTDLKALDNIKSTSNSCPKSEKRLIRRAKKLNIPYRIVEKNGKISQLITIEKDGTPVYISTDEQSSTNEIKTDENPS